MPCPNLEFCPAKIDLEHYQKYCLSEDEWRNCKYYVKYEMTPAQWKKYVGTSKKTEEGKEWRIF